MVSRHSFISCVILTLILYFRHFVCSGTVDLTLLNSVKDRAPFGLLPQGAANIIDHPHDTRLSHRWVSLSHKGVTLTHRVSLSHMVTHRGHSHTWGSLSHRGDTLTHGCHSHTGVSLSHRADTLTHGCHSHNNAANPH